MICTQSSKNPGGRNGFAENPGCTPDRGPASIAAHRSRPEEIDDILKTRIISDHVRVQWKLARLGLKAGERVWVPIGDQSRLREAYQFERLQKFISIDGMVAGQNGSVDFVPASTAGDATFGQEQVCPSRHAPYTYRRTLSNVPSRHQTGIDRRRRMTPLAVETTNLSKSYEKQPALDRVDLRVPEGSVYVLVGANGAGKSTTIKIQPTTSRK